MSVLFPILGYSNFWFPCQKKTRRDKECKRMQRRETECRHTEKEREKETQRNTHTHTHTRTHTHTHTQENLVPKGTFGGIRLSYGGRANWKEKCPKGGGGLVTKSCPTLVTPWTVACHAPLSLAFSIHPGNNTGVVCHFLLRDLADPGIEPGSPALQADTLPTVLGLKRGKEHVIMHAQNRKQPRKGSWKVMVKEQLMISKASPMSTSPLRALPLRRNYVHHRTSYIPALILSSCFPFYIVFSMPRLDLPSPFP